MILARLSQEKPRVAFVVKSTGLSATLIFIVELDLILSLLVVGR